MKIDQQADDYNWFIKLKKKNDHELIFMQNGMPGFPP
jgi:hypothetical protein